ncbi:DUF2252 domain-containing protein [Chroogloeocystis siderophila]|jgi:uncharacterized protein (DUF2252 family)|uniref:DUF2252 domain-containing protein n=1 Tax=Chroogloeocystis siderophila 5.2 s.c.1 TaxID=247279 RepID=A0A1U7HEG0_9CHRO|nr:DUF2252 domain-containing protein [Chroogloeocystis siderophila]OKH21966.1 hypothetical protein NIES1031_21090 [Chroogloeocystis siderophila 5.2 s.c.1]
MPSPASEPTPPAILCRQERRLAGKKLRQQVARSLHSWWQPTRDRPDPIELIKQSNQRRILELVPIRHWRMMQSPFAFLRGSAIVMAADLATTPTTGIMVQACGDCHLLNFGGFATPERNLIFDLNDFDETLVAPWEWDIKRLVTSIAIAGRDLCLSERDSLDAAQTAAQAYRLAIARYSEMRTLEIWYARLDASLLIEHAPDEDTRQQWAQMATKAFNQTLDRAVSQLTELVNGQRRLIDNPPLLYHPPNQKEYFEEIQALFEEYRDTLQVDRQFLLDRYRLVDVALKVVGVGSVGTHCGVALLLDDNDDPLLLQYKEARPSVLEPYAGKSPYPHEGQRIVSGQRLMQAASDIFLGWTSNLQGQDFYFRQLKDMKTSIKLKGMSARRLEDYAEICGAALARAHARTGDSVLISGYLGNSDAFDRAVTDFAVTYAYQVEQDHRAFVEALQAGRIEAKAG